jgi:type I restriction enzyme S subunit
METENVHIRKWGNVGEGYLGPAFIRRFRKGQVLYGSRRTYLKKVAVAEWDGVTANTTFVLEAVEGKLLQELLPWLMLSERFTRHSIQESKGSTNPYINFPDIAKFEFTLPPLDQQRRIAEILWAMDTHLQSVLEIARSTAATKVSVLSKMLPRNGTFGAEVNQTISLQELCTETITYGIVQAGPDTPGGIPYIRVTDMTNGPLKLEGTLRTTPEIAARFKRSTVRSGEIVCALRGPAGLLKVVPPELDGANLTQGTARISLKDKALTSYVLRAFESPFVAKQVNIQAKGSTFSELTLASLRQVSIPLLRDKDRSAFEQRVESLDKAHAAASASAESSRRLLVELTNAFTT